MKFYLHGSVDKRKCYNLVEQKVCLYCMYMLIERILLHFDWSNILYASRKSFCLRLDGKKAIVTTRPFPLANNN